MIEDPTTNALHLLKGTSIDVCRLASSRKLTVAKFQSRIGLLAGIPRSNYYDASHAFLLSVFRRCKIDGPGKRSFIHLSTMSPLSVSDDNSNNVNALEKSNPMPLLPNNQSLDVSMLRSNNVNKVENPDIL